MKTWTLAHAQAHFVEIVHSSGQEPQLVYDRDVPLAVVIDIRLYRELMELRLRQKQPTIRQLFDELRAIQTLEQIEIDIPARQDREIDFNEVHNGISV